MWWVLTVLILTSSDSSPQLTIKEYYGEPRCRQQEEIVRKLARRAGGLSNSVRAETDCTKKLTD